MAVRARQHGRAAPTTGHGKQHGHPVVVAVPCTHCFTSLLRRLLFLARGICYGLSLLGRFLGRC